MRERRQSIEKPRHMMTRDQIGILSFAAGMVFMMVLDLMWRAA